jgi:hypothetical protein
MTAGGSVAGRSQDRRAPISRKRAVYRERVGASRASTRTAGVGIVPRGQNLRVQVRRRLALAAFPLAPTALPTTERRGSGLL